MALARANERCEAVVLLASPASLASTECRLELRMAEDYGKEIVIAIIASPSPDSRELDLYRERQIIDLSQEPREAVFTVTHKGQQRTITFTGLHLTALNHEFFSWASRPKVFHGSLLI